MNKLKLSTKIILVNSLVCLTLLFCFGASVSAQGVTVPVNPPDKDSSSGNVSLVNPLGPQNNDPRVIIGNVIKAVLGLVGSLALLMFIYGGFLWITAGGKEESIAKGKNILIWTTLGLALIFFSYILVTFVINAITTGAGAPAK